MSEPSDANALRGTEFKRLLSTPKVWVWIGLPAAIVLIGGALTAGPAAGTGPGLVVGLIFALVVTLVGVGIAFWVADSRAAKAFYRSYADSRGLVWHEGGGQLDGTSPLLRKGDSRRVNQLFTGKLTDGIEGSLALFTYTVESHDSDGNDSSTDYPFTVVTVKMPQVTAHLADLRVQRKGGLKALEKFEDKFRFKHERVTLESEALRDRYEIFVSKGQDQVWVRRLFSPTFIVWLVESPPKKFAFEIEDGYFVAYIPKHRNSAVELDEMRDVSCQVAERIITEVGETTGPDRQDD